MYAPHHPLDPHQPEVYMKPFFYDTRKTEDANAEAKKPAPPVMIRDSRAPSEFKQCTFSKFRLTDVRREIGTALTKQQIEQAVYWSAELLCSGHQGELWEVLSIYACKQIGLACPKLAMYLRMRLDNFTAIEKKERLESVLEFRNSAAVRKLFAEISCILAFAPKRPTFEYTRIQRAEEFDLDTWTDRLRAPDMEFVGETFREEDPREMFIPCNEFAYCIAQRDVISACYWIEWVLEFDTLCRRKRERLHCEGRRVPGVAYKLQKEVVWMLWEVLLRAVKPRGGVEDADGDAAAMAELAPRDIMSELVVEEGDSVGLRTVKALLSLFAWDFTAAAAKRRRALLYYAVIFLSDSAGADMSVPILSPTRKKDVSFVLENLNGVYRAIAQKSERSARSMSLFDGTLDGAEEEDEEEMERRKEAEERARREKQCIPGELHYRPPVNVFGPLDPDDYDDVL